MLLFSNDSLLCLIYIIIYKYNYIYIIIYINIIIFILLINLNGCIIMFNNYLVSVISERQTNEHIFKSLGSVTSLFFSFFLFFFF